MADSWTTTSGTVAAAGTVAEPTKPATAAPVASTSTSADALKYDIECPICLNVFEEPKQLSCGHVVCGECVTNAMRADGMRQGVASKFRCPECRVQTIVPPSGLSTNYTVKKLVAQISQMAREEGASNNSRCTLCARRVSSDKELFVCVSCSPVSNSNQSTAFCASCRDACGHDKHASCIAYDTIADEEYRCAAYGRIASTLETCEGDTRRAGDALKHLFQRATRFSAFYSIGQQVFELERHPSKKHVDDLLETANEMARKLRQHCANVMEMRDVEFAVFLEQLAAVTKIREATQRAQQQAAQSAAVDPDDDDVIFVAQTTNPSSTASSNPTTTVMSAATATVPTTTSSLIPAAVAATNDTNAANETSSANVPATGPTSPDVLPAEISQIALSLNTNSSNTLNATEVSAPRSFIEEYAALIAASDIPTPSTDSVPTSASLDLSQQQRPSTSQAVELQTLSSGRLRQQTSPSLQRESLSSAFANNLTDLSQDWSLPEESSSGESTYDSVFQAPTQISYGEPASSSSLSSSRKRRRFNRYQVIKEEPLSAESDNQRAALQLRLRLIARSNSHTQQSTSATASSQPTAPACPAMVNHHHESVPWSNQWLTSMWQNQMQPSTATSAYHAQQSFHMPVYMQQHSSMMRHIPHWRPFYQTTSDGRGTDSATPSAVCEPYAAAISTSRIASDTEL